MCSTYIRFFFIFKPKKEMLYKGNAKCLITKLIKSNCESNKNVRLEINLCVINLPI